MKFPSELSSSGNWTTILVRNSLRSAGIHARKAGPGYSFYSSLAIGPQARNLTSLSLSAVVYKVGMNTDMPEIMGYSTL